uniref:G-protein coupled receptors family 1 profile domain-containing protein n=1 Tax=Plectus sambesii TaxID=2011161 RepID=A0A914ULD3_9BILA
MKAVEPANSSCEYQAPDDRCSNESDAPHVFDPMAVDYQMLLLPCICFTGIFGNSMALLLIRTNYWLRRLPSNIYLSILSISGSVFLSTVLLMWMDMWFQLPLYNGNEFGCKMLTFLAHCCDFLCVWMIIFVSFDRAVVLFRPSFRKTVCSVKFARRVVVGTVIAGFLMYSWCLLLAGLEHNAELDITECGVIRANWTFDLNQLYVMFIAADTVISNFVPSVIIVVVNALAIHRYRSCMRLYSSGLLRVRFLRPPSATPATDRRLTEQAKGLLFSQTNTSTSMCDRNSVQSRKLRSSDLQLTRTLLIVTSTFVLLNLPSYGLRLYQNLFQFENRTSQAFLVINFVAYLMYYVHHAVLFYMYIFWSPQMKKELKPTAIKLLECYCCKTVPEFGHDQKKRRGISAHSVRRID